MRVCLLQSSFTTHPKHLLTRYPKISIIIVHGLNGGPAKTFRHPDTDNIWFRDILPEHVLDKEQRTNARIWTYGYNAAFAFQNAGNAGAFDFALELLESVMHVRKQVRIAKATGNHITYAYYVQHSKIIWVGHSLGGIVIKTVCLSCFCSHRA